MSIEISNYPPEHTQETDHESWHFEQLEYLRDSEDAARGEEFSLELSLIPVTNYFGMDRAIVVSHYSSPVSLLPPEVMEEFWPLCTNLHTQKEVLEVSARAWTSPEDREFYASVRIDLPSISEVEDTVRYELGLDDEVQFSEVPNFQNYIEDYTSTRWREFHGMTAEEYERRSAETSRRVAAMMKSNSEKNSLLSEGVSTSTQDRTPALMDYNNAQKKPVVTWLIWLFLGSIGVHRFYLGDTKQGVLMLIAGLCFWVPGLIWALLDAFKLNGRIREINRAAWTKIAAKHGVAVEPLPEGAYK